MATIRCWVCSHEREAGLGPIEPLCSDECAEFFAEVVGELSAAAASISRVSGIGSEYEYLRRRLRPVLERLEIDPVERLAAEAIEEVLRHWRSELVEAREWRQHDWERSRPDPAGRSAAWRNYRGW